MHDEGQFWKRADEVLIAEPDPEDLERDTYQEWLEEHSISRTDPRLRSLRVQLRTLDHSDKPQKHYLLPSDILKSLLEGELPTSVGDRETSTAAGSGAVSEAVSEVVSEWAGAEVDRCVVDYRAATAANDQLEQVRIWQRVDTVHRLIRSLGTEADLDEFGQTLQEQGIPANEPEIDITEGVSEIDLRQSPRIGSQLRSSGRSLLSKSTGFGRRRGGNSTDDS